VTRTEEEVLEAIERRRRRGHVKLLDTHVTLSHGAGGKSSHALVETVFEPALRNPLLAPLGDAALLAPAGDRRLAFSTDASVVRPLFFPGGDFVLEEGLPVDDLRRIAESAGRAARAAGVVVATGDTKVVERGKADGVYIATSGVGVVEHDLDLSPGRIRPGDRVLVSGSLGDHGMAILIARGDLELEGDLRSDTAPLHTLVAALLAATGGVRCLRDPTRGGLATVVNELASSAGVGIVLDESALPVRPEVNGACEILGIDPLYVANEGKLVAIVAPEAADDALAALRAHSLGAGAAVVGEVVADPPAMVLLHTAFGGSRVVDMLAGDPLPRIC
jgi:hydrogenase expression/formation protein HypE